MPLKKIERNVYKDPIPWKVENISKFFSKVNTEKYQHPEYPVQKTHYFSSEFQGHKVGWYVKLKFCNDKLIGGFMIDFDAVNKLEPKNHVTCNFYLVDADKNKFFLGRKNRRFDDSNYSFFPGTGRTSFCGCDELPNAIDKLLPNDTMTLDIELIFYLDDDPIFPYEYQSPVYEADLNLSDDFSKLYEVQDDGDVMIYVQDVKFSVHEEVLKARLPKLYEMVNNQQLTLMFIQPEIFERVLEFIYTRKVEDLDDHAEDLLEAASKYELTRLKNLCELSLIEHYLTYQNSNEVEKLAICFGAFQLRGAAFSLRENIHFANLAYHHGVENVPPQKLSNVQTGFAFAS